MFYSLHSKNAWFNYSVRQLRKAKKKYVKLTKQETNTKKHQNKIQEGTLLLLVWQPKNDLSNTETGNFTCECTIKT